MSDLVKFLTARLDEDKAIAQAALDANDPPWKPCEHYQYEHARHVARWVEQRVLREVEAKRAILAEHEIRDGRCRVCTAIADGRATRFRAPCWTLRQLLSVYSDHPDYDPEWKPEP